MRKWLAFVLTVVLWVGMIPQAEAIEANKEELELDAEAVILMDAVSGTVLYQKNAFEKEYPASITKIMTVYLALEKGTPDQLLTASDTAIDNFDRSSTHIWLDYGEQLTLLDACYAAMLQSANDAANVLAEGIGGTQENFALMMNEAAAAAGAMNTHFTNAHGLPDENHTTTAYDMAMITRQALMNEEFRTIFETYSYTMAPTNKQEESRVFATGNEMMKKGKYQYEYASGGKVGWTEDAGYTMVATAKKDGMELIAVVMKCSSKDARYDDARQLFEYGFENYKTVVVAAADQEPYSYQIKKKDQVAADCVFTMENDFRILLDAEAIEDLIQVEVEVRNETDPETIEGVAVLTMSGQKMAEQTMKAEITTYDLSFRAVTLPKIMKGVDVLAAGVFILFLILSVLAAAEHRLEKKNHR